MKRGVLAWLGIFVRGLAMGVAEVIPGVSGGTIAFVSGIYTELLASIAGLGPEALLLLFRKGPVYFWQQYNLTFLAVLFLGMACSILLLAKVVLFLLATFPLYLWAFFFGLICASVVTIVAQASRVHILSFGLVGFIAGLVLSMSVAMNLSATPLNIFIGGMLAVSAWILPGVSGSYILLILGLYASILVAVDTLDFTTLFTMAGGCILGLLVFSRLLSWLLMHYRSAVMALLGGFTAGSLVKLWPWQDVSAQASHSASSVAPVLPWNYLHITGNEPLITGVFVACIAGITLVIGITLFTAVESADE